MGRESAEVIVWLPSLYGSIILPLEGKLIGRTEQRPSGEKNSNMPLEITSKHL